MSTWTMFGSIMHHTKPSTTPTGHNDRNGVRYEWIFGPTSGRVACAIYVDGVRVR